MAAVSPKFVSWLVCFVVLLGCFLQTGSGQNIKVEFYSSVTLPCDNKDLNITMNPANYARVANKYWILPSGSMIDNTSHSDMVENNVYRWSISKTNFNLTINRVDDDDFGMYTCVVIFYDYQVKIVRRGLNMDGADFSKLQETYRENAIIGGIAAACLFAVFSSACVIWHCRFSSRQKGKEGLEKGDTTQAFHNSALEIEETNHL